jgi:hypothetical protein
MTAITDQNAGEMMNKRDQTEVVIAICIFEHGCVNGLTARSRL